MKRWPITKQDEWTHEMEQTRPYPDGRCPICRRQVPSYERCCRNCLKAIRQAAGQTGDLDRARAAAEMIRRNRP